MTTIKQQDFVRSIADSLQHIACFHPPDFIKALAAAYDREQSMAAKDAIAQILTNSRMAAQSRRPICQDTGIVVAFIEVGMAVRWDTEQSLQELVDEGVRQAYNYPENVLRASVVANPAGNRQNTKDNSPAIVHVKLVPGDKIDIRIAAKGGGSENKTKFTVLNPSDSLVDWVLKMIPAMGAGWCPPGILGIGIGGSTEKSMLLAKEALMEPIDMLELLQQGAKNAIDELRLEIYEKVNALGIGAQGLGGLTTVLDVKILDYPTHAASLPVAMIPNCAATRHIHFTLDGTGPAHFEVPSLQDWPAIQWQPGDDAKRVDLDNLTKADVQAWQPGDRLLLSGRLLTGRDAAHKRIKEALDAGAPLPDGVDFTNRFIYYVGPVDPVAGEVVGPAGPTTSTRMDKFTDLMLGQTGLIGMVGKAERGPATIASIKQHKAVYLVAVGGAAFLVSKAIREARVVAFGDLGMEAIYEFVVSDMPVTVAVDSRGVSVHTSGPLAWRKQLKAAV